MACTSLRGSRGGDTLLRLLPVRQLPSKVLDLLHNIPNVCCQCSSIMHRSLLITTKLLLMLKLLHCAAQQRPAISATVCYVELVGPAPHFLFEAGA